MSVCGMRHWSSTVKCDREPNHGGNHAGESTIGRLYWGDPELPCPTHGAPGRLDSCEACDAEREEAA